MKKTSVMKKIFLGLLGFTTLCGLAAFIFSSIAERSDPHFMTTIMEQMGNKFSEGKPYDEVSEEDLHGFQTLRLLGTQGDIEVHTYDGDTLKLSYSGKIPKEQEARLIRVQREGEALSVEFGAPERHRFFHIQWNDNVKGLNYSDVALTAKVYVPRSFRGDLQIRNVNGDIDMSDLHLHRMEIHSVRGDVEVQDSEAGFIQADLVNGDCTAENVRAGQWDVKDIRGDVTLSLPEGQMYLFELSSMNGNIENESGLGANEKTNEPGQVRVKTVSGDITINKYVETKDDRE